MRRARLGYWISVAAMVSLVAACTTKKQEAPPLTGPSGFGTSITVSITPDVITQDGASQSVVTVTALDANGQPVRNLTVRVETRVNGVAMDFGTLSARTVVTGADGRATLTYTAPAGVVGGAETRVDIVVVPVGSDFNTAIPRTASVRLVPQGVVLPPSGLVPAFTISPASPTEDQPVLFDASESKGAVTYAWTFGDGRSGSGRVATNTYSEPGTFFATLTIADEFGRNASATKTVTIGAGVGPTADFVFSPTAPVANQAVNFNAAASKAPAGASIAGYSWDFGDGTSGAGLTASHAYAANGGYTVTLVVTDSTGKTATKSTTVTVGNDSPTAVFTVSPTAPTAGVNVNFNGSQSTAIPGRTIVSYTWSFGDGGTASGQSVTHPFAAPGTYTVTLTVVDSAGRSSSTTLTVTVT
jgi:PKD repeat protein